MTQATVIQTPLTCESVLRGGGRCRRAAVAIVAFTDPKARVRFEPICKLHKNAQKTYTWIKYVETDEADALAWLTDQEMQKREAAAERSKAEHARQTEIRERRLVEAHESRVQTWTVVREDDRSETDYGKAVDLRNAGLDSDEAYRQAAIVKPRWVWQPESDVAPRYGYRELTIKREYPNDERFPAYIEARVPSGMTANEARALAQALLIAAAEADRSIGIKPITEAERADAARWLAEHTDANGNVHKGKVQ